MLRPLGFLARFHEGHGKEIWLLEHLEHGVEHDQHDQDALCQPASVQGRSLRISDSWSCQSH